MGKVVCPRCGKSGQTDHLPGAKLRCGRCKTSFLVADTPSSIGSVEPDESIIELSLADNPGSDQLGATRAESKSDHGGEFICDPPVAQAGLKDLSPTMARSAEELEATVAVPADAQIANPSDGPRLGGYAILLELGHGGMGRVYKARHDVLRRTVALKVLARRDGKNLELVERFRREARAVANLEHPNLVKVFEVGEDDGRHYLAMEYVEGGTVAQLIRKQGKLSWRQAAEIALSVAQALEATHENRLIHRDVKPSNILIGRAGVVKLSDLGLVRRHDEAETAQITATGQLLGTVDYMAPEQITAAQKVDVRADLYALGCTLYHMLTGEPPFPDRPIYGKLDAHIHEPIPDVTLSADNVPEMLQRILLRLTQKDPSKRYQAPTEVVSDLTTLLEHGESADLFAELAARAEEFEMERLRRRITGEPLGSQLDSATRTRVQSAVSWAMIAAALVAIVGLGLFVFQSLSVHRRERTVIDAYYADRPGESASTRKPEPPDENAESPGTQAAGSLGIASTAPMPVESPTESTGETVVASLDKSAAPRPADVTSKPKTLVVGPATGELADLKSAFEQAHPGDTIEIRHRGPIEIDVVDISGKTPLSIVGGTKDGVDYWPIVRQAEKQPQPPGAEANAKPTKIPALFSSDRLELTLRKLHLVAAGPNRDALSAICACTHGRIALEQCTVTVGVEGGLLDPPGDPIPLIVVRPADVNARQKTVVILDRCFLRGDRLRTCIQAQQTENVEIRVTDSIWAGGPSPWIVAKELSGRLRIVANHATIYNASNFLLYEGGPNRSSLITKPHNSSHDSKKPDADKVSPPESKFSDEPMPDSIGGIQSPAVTVRTDKCLFVAPYASSEPFIAWNPDDSANGLSQAVAAGHVTWHETSNVFFRYPGYFHYSGGARPANMSLWRNLWKDVGQSRASKEADPIFRVLPDGYVLQESFARDYQPRFWRNKKRGERVTEPDIGADQALLPYALPAIYTRPPVSSADAAKPRGQPRILQVHQKDGPYKTLEAAFADAHDDDIIEIADSGTYVPTRRFDAAPGETPPNYVISAAASWLTLRSKDTQDPIVWLKTAAQSGKVPIDIRLVSGSISVEGIHFRIVADKSRRAYVTSGNEQNWLRCVGCTILGFDSGHVALVPAMVWLENNVYDGVAIHSHAMSSFVVIANCLTKGTLVGHVGVDGNADLMMLTSSNTLAGSMLAAQAGGEGLNNTFSILADDNIVVATGSPFSNSGPFSYFADAKRAGSNNALWVGGSRIGQTDRMSGVNGLLPGPALSARPIFEGPGSAKDPYRQWRLRKGQPAATMARDGGPVGVRFEYLPDLPDAAQLPKELFQPP